MATTVPIDITQPGITCSYCKGILQVLTSGIFDVAASNTALNTHRSTPCSSGAPNTTDPNADYTSANTIGSAGPDNLVETLTTTDNCASPAVTPYTRITGAGTYTLYPLSTALIGLQKTIENAHSAAVTIALNSGESLLTGMTTTTYSATYSLRPGEVLRLDIVSATTYRNRPTQPAALDTPPDPVDPGTRNFDTKYQNTSGRPMRVLIWFGVSTGAIPGSAALGYVNVYDASDNLLYTTSSVGMTVSGTSMSLTFTLEVWVKSGQKYELKKSVTGAGASVAKSALTEQTY